jgi:carbon-monoxide dehydrogenase medium subunit
MKPPAFHYFDPTTVAEAIDLLQHNENAKILAGGQSLMPMLNMRFVLPDALIDLNRIKDLSYIRRGTDTLEIGAMTRQRDIEFSPEMRAACPIVIEAIKNVGHRQTRNRGTIGGSLCHLDPAAELVTVASVLDGTVEVTGPEGRRDIHFVAFPAGYMAPAIEMNEIVTGIRLPIWSKTHGYAFIEFARRHGDFALASVAALIDIDAEGRIARAAVAVGGVASVPLRMPEMEAGLVGQVAGDDLFKKVSRMCETIETVEDAHVPASYRRRLAGVLSFRALRLASMRAHERRAS